MFDPIHVGHLWLARFALERMSLHQVLLVPAADPPHKTPRGDTAPGEDRWTMVLRALRGVPGLKGSRIELERTGKSYTVDTLAELASLHPDWELFLIIGGDNVRQMPTWHEPQQILQRCTVVAGSRPAEEADESCAFEQYVVRLDIPRLDISSTDVRRRLAAGLPVRYLVPEAVERYIHERGLYGAAREPS